MSPRDIAHYSETPYCLPPHRYEGFFLTDVGASVAYLFFLIGDVSVFEMLNAQWLTPEVKRFEMDVLRVAAKRRAVQFLIVRLHDDGEHISQTVADSDAAAGITTLAVQGTGKATRLMNSLETGQLLLDVVGPVGNPTDIRRYGTVVVIAGGVGTANAWRIQARSLGWWRHRGGRRCGRPHHECGPQGRYGNR